MPMHMGAKDGHEDRRVGRGVGRVREGERLLVPDKNPRIEVYLLCAKADRMTHTAYVARKKKTRRLCLHACVRTCACTQRCACQRVHGVPLLYWARWRGRAKVEPASLSFDR